MENTINVGDMRPLYLLAEKGTPATTRFAKALWVSDDKLLRALSKEFLSGKDLHTEIEPYIESKIGWILSTDDTVQDRLWSYESKNDVVGQHYSGRHKAIVNGVDVVTLFWVNGDQRLPLTFRVYDKDTGKNKHDLLREMIEEVLDWWYKPSVVTADSFYATNDNITRCIQKGLSVFMGVKSNRVVREPYKMGKEKATKYQTLAEMSIPWEGKVLHFKWLWMLKVFMFGDRHYVFHSASDTEMTTYETTKAMTREEAILVHRLHWYIEEYHRVLKQLCNFEGMIFRTERRILNHIFYSIKAFCILEITRRKKNLDSWYATISNQTLKYTKHLMNKMSLDWLCLCD